METNRLKQFCVIVETGSLTKASELLGISHGGLSKSMSVLQEELKVELLIPNGRGLVTTDDGRRIYGKARELLEKVDALTFSEVQAEQYRIGALEVFCGAVFSQTIFDSKPTANFTLLELNPGQIESALVENRIDTGFTYLPVTVEGAEHLKIANFKFGVYARVGEFDGVPTSELPFVAPASFAPLNPLGIKERDVWPDGLFPRNKKYLVNLLSTALNLAQGGLCALYIPEFVAAYANELASPKFRLEPRRLPAQFERQEFAAYLVKRAASKESPLMKKLASEIRRKLR